MTKHIDLTQVQTLVERGQQAEGLKKKLQDQVGKVQKAQQQLTEQLEALSSLLQEGKKAGGRGRPKGRGMGKAKVAKGGKEARPKPGSSPDNLCKVMSSTKPMQIEEIAKATKLSEGTVKQYIHKYDCFYLAGRGKGYLCKGSSSTAPTGMGFGVTEGEKAKAKKAKKKATKKTKKAEGK
jgi:hypothetical protein